MYDDMIIPFEPQPLKTITEIVRFSYFAFGLHGFAGVLFLTAV
jgi:hypothetical protein